MKVRKEKGILYFTKDTGDIATVSMIDGSMMEYKVHKKKWDMQKKCEDYESKLNKQKHFIWILICLNSLCLLV